ANVFRAVLHRGMSVGIELLPDQLLEECHRVYAAAPRRPDEKLLQVRVKRERPLLASESRLGHTTTYIIRAPSLSKTVPGSALSFRVPASFRREQPRELPLAENVPALLRSVARISSSRSRSCFTGTSLATGSPLRDHDFSMGLRHLVEKAQAPCLNTPAGIVFVVAGCAASQNPTASALRRASSRPRSARPR